MAVKVGCSVGNWVGGVEGSDVKREDALSRGRGRQACLWGRCFDVCARFSVQVAH